LSDEEEVGRLWCAKDLEGSDVDGQDMEIEGGFAVAVVRGSGEDEVGIREQDFEGTGEVTGEVIEEGSGVGRRDSPGEVFVGGVVREEFGVDGEDVAASAGEFIGVGEEVNALDGDEGA
jgi:hypothetical protein